jgi:hypothetical protein
MLYVVVSSNSSMRSIKMKKALLVCALGSAALFGSQVAKADTYSLSFFGSFLDGTQVTNGQSSPGVTDITFSTNGTPTPGTFFNPTQTPISGISGTVIIGGQTYNIGPLDNGLGGNNDLSDNYLGVLNPNGLDFDLTAIGSPNPDYTELMLSYNIVTGAYDYTTEHCGRKGCTPETVSGDNFGFQINDIDPSPAATPEPGSLALLGTSILGGAGILRRRFRA